MSDKGEKTEIKPTLDSSFFLDVKRCHLPWIVVSSCPKCGARVERDYREEYISYPTLGVPLELHLYHECDDNSDSEWSITVVIKLSMELVP